MQNNYKYCAFFDVDGTIISMKTMFSFLEYYDKQNVLDYLVKQRYNENKKMFEKQVKDFRNCREWINTMYYKLFSGIEINYLKKLGQNWFNEVFNESHLNLSIMEEMNIHRKNGAAIVLVSGSMKACLDPLARVIDPTYVLCTRQEVANGIVTGNILPPQTIGVGKAIAMKNLCRYLGGIDLQTCFAYGDHISDLYMLEKVGYPRVVRGDHLLERVALERGWNIV